MKFLVVDDDFVSRSLMNTILSRYGVCDIAVSAEESVFAYKRAFKSGSPYSALFLDILMPGQKDGMDALREIRKFEKDRKLTIRNSIKVIIVSGLDEPDAVMGAFRDQCDAYIFKPIKEDKILGACKKAELEIRDRKCEEDR